MPVYEFKCECGHTEEVLQDIEEEHKYDCIKCKEPMNRKFSTFMGIIGKFKPFGWEPKKMDGEADRRAYHRSKEMNANRRVI